MENPHFARSSLSMASHTPQSEDYMLSPDGSRIRRPRNPFVIFRSDYAAAKKRRYGNSGPQRALSKEAGAHWRDLLPEIREVYIQRADVEKEVHK